MSVGSERESDVYRQKILFLNLRVVINTLKHKRASKVINTYVT